MYIKKLYIKAFGPITNTDFDFENGLNIIEGHNESGKTAVAMFIKFIFYGLSSRAAESNVSEKDRYINWSVGEASGYAVCVFTENGQTQTLRIERILTAKSDIDGKTKYSEKLRVVDNETLTPVSVSGQPGDFFFEVPENVFTSSAFVSQEGDMKPGSDSLKEAVENIICAADENVSVKRAADLINKARKKLLHKNRTGGDIIDLENRRDELERRVSESVDTSNRLIKAELSLVDTKSNIESAAARNAELEEALSAIAILSAEAKVKRIAELNETLAATKKELQTANSSDTNNEILTSLAVSVKDIERFDKQKAEYELLKEAVKNKCGSPDRDPAEDHTRAVILSKKSNIRFTAGALLLIVGLLGIIGSAALKFFNRPGFEIGLALTSLLILAGIITMILSSRTRKQLYDILDYWKIEDENDIDQLIDNADGIYSELSNARLTLASAEDNAQEAKNNIINLAEKAGINTADVTVQSLIKQLAAIGAESIKRKKALEANIARIEGQLSETVTSLGNVSYEDIIAKANEVRKTAIGAIASKMSDSDATTISKELQFNKNKIEKLRDRLILLERECAALKATYASPAKDAEALESLTAEITKLKSLHDSLVLAGDTLAAAGENIRQSVVPRLTAEASEIMDKITDGRYSSLGITPSFDMNFRDSASGTLELDYLSAGTKDIAYIALRLALMKSLFDEGKRPPIIFDESLSSLDKGRVRRAVGLLENADMQTFLFTCRSLEGELSEKAEKIRLRRN